MAQEKFAVVTGASSGIGYELAKVFAKNGYDLLVTSGGEKIENAAADFDGFGASPVTRRDRDGAAFSQRRAQPSSVCATRARPSR